MLTKILSNMSKDHHRRMLDVSIKVKGNSVTDVRFCHNTRKEINQRELKVSKYTSA